jgi:hypothetical protein
MKKVIFEISFLEPHIAAESELDIIDTEVTHEMPLEKADIADEETVTTIGWEPLCFGDECMQFFIMIFVLLMVVCPFCSWLLKIFSCFWSCLLFCLWHG